MAMNKYDTVREERRTYALVRVTSKGGVKNEKEVNFLFNLNWIQKLDIFIPYALITPLFVYGLQNLNSPIGEYALIVSVAFAVGYSLYVPKTLAFKKHQLEYMFAWYKIASKKFPEDSEEFESFRQSLIETAKKKVVSKEHDENKRKILEDYLGKLIKDLT